MVELRPRLALDENFPPIVLDAAPLIPEVEISRLRDVDRRLLGLSDRQLIVALHQLGWTGLITNNYRMLNVPAEIAAIVRTKLTIVAVRGVGDDPLRATGSLMLDLPVVAQRLLRGEARGVVYLRRPSPPPYEEPWEYLRRAAAHRHRDVNELYAEVRVSDEELASPVLAENG